MCFEFVTQQKNVLLTIQPNLNDDKNRQVYKIWLQNSLKKKAVLSDLTGWGHVR